MSPDNLSSNKPCYWCSVLFPQFNWQVKWIGWTRWANGRTYIDALGHSCCLIMQMIWKSWTSVDIRWTLFPLCVCVCCVKCCWARSRWDQTTLDLLSEYIMTNRCAGLKHSSDTWCRTPSLQSSKALFFICSWCDEWRRLKLWTLGSVLHLVWCLLWSTVGCPNLFDNPLFVHKHSGKLIKFWEVSVCCVCCWEIVSLKPKHSIIIIIAHLYVQSECDLKWWLWV